jgi:exosome complex exonuclease RRP6
LQIGLDFLVAKEPSPDTPSSSHAIPFLLLSRHNISSFKSPVSVGVAATRADSSLGVLGASLLLPKQQPFPTEDLDDAYDWLVASNDDLLEMFAASADEFKALREKEEAHGRKVAAEEMAGDGLQVVYGKKKKKMGMGEEGVGRSEAFGSSGSVRMATMDRAGASGPKQKVPFHIPTISRPQDVHRIVVDNTSKPFDHAFLERSDDGARAIHPLVNASAHVCSNLTSHLPLNNLRFICSEINYKSSMKGA